MLNDRIDITRKSNDIFKPTIYNIANNDDRKAFEKLLDIDGVFVYDEMYDQLKELVKSRHPSIKLKDSDYKELIINIRNFFKKGKISLGKPDFTGTRLSFSRKYLFAGQAV